MIPCFHPLKSGRDHLPHKAGAGYFKRFHPLKSGRDRSVGKIHKVYRQFPSPQVGSGQFKNTRRRRKRILFPSPQVGSGPGQTQYLPRRVSGFHPLKSGRDLRLLSQFWSTHRFPSPQVGSGQICILVRRCPVRVSIPSSRVGTDDGLMRQWGNSGVSIPSSRVGTRFLPLPYGIDAKFPSPQVGSGPSISPSSVLRRCSFHPLKSGRDLQFRVITGSTAGEFPSPQVGSGPRQKGGFAPHFG